MSLKIEEISEILIQAGLDSSVRSKILKEAQTLEEEKKTEKQDNKEPKQKNKLIIFIRGDKDLAAKVQSGWVVKTAESDDTNTLESRIKIAAKEQNANGRKKSIVNTFAETFQYLKRKFSKAHAFQPMTKTCVEVVVLQNEFINE